MSPTLPHGLVAMLAERPRRLHHFLWHQTRNNWNRWPQWARDVLVAIDPAWEPPRPSRSTAGGWILDNGAGSDFLYMHREMIETTRARLAQLGEPSIPAWPAPPAPGDVEFPVPPAWTTGQSGFDDFIAEVKAADWLDAFHTSGRLPELPEHFRDPVVLAGWSLGELGARIERGLHNLMHMRWSAEPVGFPTWQGNPTDPDTIDPAFDVPAYDYLGNSYSSHVNPFFWYLHGFVDETIDHWMAAHGLSGDVPWEGRWVGPDMAGPPTPPPDPKDLKDLGPQEVIATDGGSHDGPGAMGGHGGHGGHHSHAAQMEAALKVVLSTGQLCEFYEDFVGDEPPQP